MKSQIVSSKQRCGSIIDEGEGNNKMKTERTNTNIPEGWRVAMLGEVAEINPAESLNKGKVAKSVAMESVEPFTRRISNFKLKEYNGGMKFRNGDTLFARITPCLENGKTSFVDILEDDEIGFGSTEFIVLREKENLSDKKYLYYLSLSPELREIAIRLMTGSSGRQRVQTNLFADKSFVIPPVIEQQAIAALLSSFDDKIELLREQNKTLEAIAQALYKRWFVDLEFPNEECKPYKSSGGKMVDSELGTIPAAWRISLFRDKFKVEYGKSNKKFDPNGVYPLYGAGGIIGYSNLADYTDYQVIIGCRGTCGNITLAYEDSKITHNSLVVSNEWFKPFIYLFLQGIDIEKVITGSTQPQITIANLNNIEIAIPAIGIINIFSEIIAPIFKKKKNNNSQIKTLSTLRDTLLPKLISGKIRVPVENVNGAGAEGNK